jgi:hypothetical protein
VWDHPKKWVVVEEFVMCDVAPVRQRISGPIVLSTFRYFWKLKFHFFFCSISSTL